MVIKSLVPALLVYDNKVMLYNNKAITFNLLANEIEITNFTVNEVDAQKSAITMDVYFGPRGGAGVQSELDRTIQRRSISPQKLCASGYQGPQVASVQVHATFVSEREDLKVLPVLKHNPAHRRHTPDHRYRIHILADLTEFVGRLRDNLAYYYGARWKVDSEPPIWR